MEYPIFQNTRSPIAQEVDRGPHAHLLVHGFLEPDAIRYMWSSQQTGSRYSLYLDNKTKTSQFVSTLQTLDVKQIMEAVMLRRELNQNFTGP